MSEKEITIEIHIPPKSQRVTRYPSDEDIGLVAQDIIRQVYIKTIRENRSMWIYDQEKGFYRPNAETRIEEICAKTPGFNSPSVYSKLSFNIRGMTYIDIKDFESLPGFINLKNGVYDINKDVLLEHDPKYKFRYSLNIEYNKFTSCDTFENMIRNMTESQEDYKLIQRWFGYHFVRRQPEQNALFIVGPPMTSKSTLLWVLQQLIGENNCSAHSLIDLSNANKYAVADLYNKLANINADVSSMKLKDISMFKLLTGGDLVSAREIYRRPFKFRNDSKLTFAFNRLPSIDHSILSDTAFWRRVMIINVKRGYDQVDKHIRDKLEKELPGIFNWTINGLRDLIKEGFSYYKNYEDTKEIWIQNMSDFTQTRKGIIQDNELLKIPNFIKLL